MSSSIATLSSTEGDGRALGLDLGTLRSRVAVIRPSGGRPEVLADPDGHHSVPSVVGFYADHAALVGIEAQRKQAKYLSSTLSHASALLGLSADDAAKLIQTDSLAFKLTPGSAGVPELHVDDNGTAAQISPSSALERLAASLYATAAPCLLAGPPLTAAVAVPAEASGAASALLVAAARRALPAGSSVVAVPAPLCVALAHSLDSPAPNAADAPTLLERVLVVDFGASLRLAELRVERARGLLRLVRHVHVSEVRASLLERAVMEHWAGEASRKGLGDAANILGSARSRCKLAAEVARIVRVFASATPSASAESAVHVEGLIDGQDFNSSLSRAKFDSLTDSTWRKLSAAVSAFVQDTAMEAVEAGLEPSACYAHVLLAGGHCKLPRLLVALEKLFDASALALAASGEVDALQAVAMGAAAHARSVHRLQSAAQSSVSASVRCLTRAIGLRTRHHGTARTLVPRDAPLPLVRRVRIALNNAQADALLELVEGEYYEYFAETPEEEAAVEAGAAAEEAEEAAEEAAVAAAGEKVGDFERVLARVRVPKGSARIELSLALDADAKLSLQVRPVPANAALPSAVLHVDADKGRVGREEALKLRKEADAEAHALEDEGEEDA